MASKSFTAPNTMEYHADICFASLGNNDRKRSLCEFIDTRLWCHRVGFLANILVHSWLNLWIFNPLIRKGGLGAGETAQWYRELVSPAENPSLVFSTYSKQLPNTCNLAPGDSTSSAGLGRYLNLHVHMHTETHVYTHN